MTDERQVERVSRYLDDDLDAGERVRLEEDLQRDPELSALVDRLRELRSAVRDTAVAMQPPAELDALLEPLRRSKPASGRVRPAYRYLAAAAVAAVALTLGLQVARKAPNHSLQEQSAPQRVHPPLGGGEVFQLQPLPTASAEDREMVGASDRLLAQRPPDPEVDEPQPLHIMGPLDEPEELNEAKVAAAPASGDGIATPVQVPAEVARRQRDHPSAAASRLQPAVGESAGRAPVLASPPTRGADALRVVIGGVNVVCEPCRKLAAGEGKLTITVHDGYVSACHGAPGENDQWIAAVCATLAGLEVGTLGDGSYPASVSIGANEDR